MIQAGPADSPTAIQPEDPIPEDLALVVRVPGSTP